MGLESVGNLDGRGGMSEATCDFCGKLLIGGAWHPAERTKAGSFAGTELVGLACSSCGFTTCWSLMGQHRKELKPHGFKRLSYGACPNCGTRMKDDNVLALWRDANELIADEDHCMLCGASTQLTSMRVWTGLSVEGDQISPDITWMGLVMLIPGDRARKIIQVEHFDFRICEECASKKKPERHAVWERTRRSSERGWVAQRQPFDSGMLE